MKILFSRNLTIKFRHLIEERNNHNQSYIQSTGFPQLDEGSKESVKENIEMSDFNASRFDIRKGSIIDYDMKQQNCSLRCISHKLVGLKTRFSNSGYLIDIELYTEESNEHRIDMTKTLPMTSRYIFE